MFDRTASIISQDVFRLQAGGQELEREAAFVLFGGIFFGT